MMNGGKTRKNKASINWNERKWKLPINVEKPEMVYLHLAICCCRHHDHTVISSYILSILAFPTWAFRKKMEKSSSCSDLKKVCSTFRLIRNLGLTNYSYTYKLNLEPKACPSKENINTFARINWFSKINR